jgi:hypothetical protein
VNQYLTNAKVTLMKTLQKGLKGGSFNAAHWSITSSKETDGMLKFEIVHTPTNARYPTPEAAIAKVQAAESMKLALKAGLKGAAQYRKSHWSFTAASESGELVAVHIPTGKEYPSAEAAIADTHAMLWTWLSRLTAGRVCEGPEGEYAVGDVDGVPMIRFKRPTADLTDDFTTVQDASDHHNLGYTQAVGKDAHEYTEAYRALHCTASQLSQQGAAAVRALLQLQQPPHASSPAYPVVKIEVDDDDTPIQRLRPCSDSRPCDSSEDEYPDDDDDKSWEASSSDAASEGSGDDDDSSVSSVSCSDEDRSHPKKRRLTLTPAPTLLMAKANTATATLRLTDDNDTFK